MFQRTFYILALLCTYHYVPAQLMARHYAIKGSNLTVGLMPVISVSSSALEYQLGVNQQLRKKSFAYSWGVHTIEKTRLTGISYQSKSTHVHVQQEVNRKIFDRGRSYVDLNYSNELFWNKSFSRLDLQINSVLLRMFSPSWQYAISYESQSEKVKSPFAYVGSELGSGQYRNWTAETSLKRILGKSLYIEGILQVGQSYHYKRMTHKIIASFWLSRNIKMLLELEHNNIDSRIQSNSFFMLLSSDIHLGHGYYAGTLTIYNQLSGVVGNLLRIEIRKPGYALQLQYRELRNDSLEMTITKNPFFASQILLQANILLK
ncbi:MAG: hypothetical protein OEV24_20230 [Cyclobacteriaceae bacterium]|nr:hypothetical protein [Cyclobacteriaceae bacterium]MDH5251128.1 hypothetical protein [Cyclobacteriaceae bacterium]